MCSILRQFGAIGAFVLVAVLGSAASNAQNAAPTAPALPPLGGLLVSPTYVLFDGRVHSQAIILTNRGTTPQTYRISIVNRRQMADGQLVEADTPAPGEGFADKLVRYSPRQILLAPDRPQIVRFLVQIPATLPDGEYRSHILFQQVPTEAPTDEVTTKDANGFSVTIRAIFGLTVPLVVRKGNLSATASLSDLHLVHLAEHQEALALRLNRAGTRSLRGDFHVLVDGSTAGVLTNVSVFLSTPYREVTIPLAVKGELKGRRISVQFAESDEIRGAASATQTLAP